MTACHREVDPPSIAPQRRGCGACRNAVTPNDASDAARVATHEKKQVAHSLHGSNDAGSVYLRDPDNILVEVTTGY